MVLDKSVEPVKWLLVIAIAYSLAMTIWVFFETPVATPMQADSQTRQQSQQRAPVNANRILSKHLFGEAGAQAPVQDNQETSVQTRLPLELQSVFVSEIAEESTAIVAQKGKSGRMYRVGDNLPGNAELVEVAHDQIYIRRAGVRESLPFPKLRSTGTMTTQTIDPPEASEPADYEFENTEQTIAAVREEFIEDAQGTLERFGLEASEEGGYVIGSSVESRILQQTGLQSGDVILSINGQQVGNLQQDQLELDNILAQGSARIEVQRGSRRFFVTARLPNQG